ncbi:MAG: hypothetical protein HYR94_06085 [Chloroflexi bacterium]|nr:hypothetical protein [Chloroflexota bacterium]
MLSHLFRIRYFAILVLIMVFASSVYAFAAANVVPETGAGDGSNTISGYTVSNVTYSLNAASPANIDTVSFDLAPTAGAGPATTVKAQLVTGGAWFNCTTPGASRDWDCSVAGAVTALAANNLHVVAAQ